MGKSMEAGLVLMESGCTRFARTTLAYGVLWIIGRLGVHETISFATILSFYDFFIHTSTPCASATEIDETLDEATGVDSDGRSLEPNRTDWKTSWKFGELNTPNRL